MEYLKEENFPDYSSVYSRMDFTQKQLLILLFLKSWMNLPYEKFVMVLYLCDKVIKALKLRKIPHFTTLQKFSKRIDNQGLKKILRDFRKFCSHKNFLAAMDGTGYSIRCRIKEGKVRKRRKNFLKIATLWMLREQEGIKVK